MNKTNVWEYDETKELLNIMVKQNSLKHFNGKIYTNAEIFKKVETELKERGFSNKNDKQIENRWKNLKNRYNMVKNMDSQSGNERSMCPFYDELSNMLEVEYQPSIKRNMWEDDELEERQSKRMKIEYCEIEKRTPVKRNIWEYDETKELLNIMIEQESLKHFNGKHFKNAEIYKKIEKELRKRGFMNKSDKQIENRWKNLKKEYCKVKKMNITSNEVTLCPFFDEIDNMLSMRSSVNSSDNGIDTSRSIFIEENDGIFLQEPSSPTSEENIFDSKPSPKVIDVPESTTLKVNATVQRKQITSKPTYNRRIGMDRFGSRMKRTQEELTKQFFEDQKKLIDYEFNLYLKNEEELQKKFHESTKKMLEENTKNFLQGLQLLLQKNNSNSSAKDVSEFMKFSTEDCH